MMLPLKSKPHVRTAELVLSSASCFPAGWHWTRRKHSSDLQLGNPPTKPTATVSQAANFTHRSHSPKVDSCCRRSPSRHFSCPLMVWVKEIDSFGEDGRRIFPRIIYKFFSRKCRPWKLKPFEGYNHSRRTTQLPCDHCRCRAAHRWQSTTHWPPGRRKQKRISRKSRQWQKGAKISSVSSPCLWLLRRAGLLLCCTWFEWWTSHGPAAGWVSVRKSFN